MKTTIVTATVTAIDATVNQRAAWIFKKKERKQKKATKEAKAEEGAAEKKQN